MPAGCPNLRCSESGVYLPCIPIGSAISKISTDPSFIEKVRDVVGL